MQSEPTSYDLVNYPSYTHPQTHPDRLSVIGSLFGLDPAPVDRCRVLELACGDGSNLAPMAWAMPRSEFIGVGLASRPIARGRQMIAELGFRNIELRHADIMDLKDDLGKFDYILAHGLYSWVPRAVQNRVLAVCGDFLAPQGIAFVSYNALPGGHLRNMLREMLLFHVRDLSAAGERVKQAQALCQLLAEGQDTRDEYRLWMKAELARIIEHDEGHLYHDELAEVNEPLYFTQFMQRSAAHGLQYLGEADYFEMSDHLFAEPVRKALERLRPNRILREQYMDFVKCRRFRQTLLCHREVSLRTEPQIGKVAGFMVSSAAACQGGKVDVRSGVDCTFESPKGARVTTDLAPGKAALAALEAAWPRPLAFEELLREVTWRLKEGGAQTGDDSNWRESLVEFLHRLYGAGVVEFRTLMPAVTRAVSERPVVNPVARWQAQHGEVVTSMFHIAVKVEDEIGRQLLSWLDGTLDRKALLEKLCQWFERNAAAPVPDGQRAGAFNELEVNLEKNLEKLARLGLLAG